MPIKITSPIEGLNARSNIGPVRLEFRDGVAEVEENELPAGTRAYLQENGYGIDGYEPTHREKETPQPLDPTKVCTEKVGTPTRDGAVDPRPGDFLGPTNAGEANPHGSEVVNPEIHASEGVRPVKGGVVHVDDADAHDAAEKAHAEAATDGTPVEVTDAEKADQPDPLPTGAEPVADVELKGQALEDALEERGLSKAGTADEKRARVAEHDDASKGQG